MNRPVRFKDGEMNRTLKVLIVDDSPTARQLLKRIIDSAPDMRVVGEAQDGHQAVDMARELRPDIIAMDLVMPKMDGLDATAEIMHVTPTPIVVISASLEERETDIAFQAINRGALNVRRKPVGPGDPHHAAQAAALLNTLRAMAEVRVIHHWRREHRPGVNGSQAGVAAPDAVTLEAVPTIPRPAAQPEIIAIVSSTGGPAALSTVLRRLPDRFPVPIVVAQHIAPDFVQPLADWLSSVTPTAVGIAVQGERPQPGRVYLSPGDAHLQLTRSRRFDLDARPGPARFIPSGDILLGSVAKAYGADAVGIVLTGMGDDGARGLRAMHDAGAFTIAQDQATSAVFGMPREAIAMGAARRVMPLDQITSVLIYLAGKGQITP
jgi:two-component system chemotaxis response regulator CheB